MLFTEKYAPRGFEGFVGNSEVVNKVKVWSSAWEQGQKQKPLLFYGVTGVGKTALALLTAQEMNWQLFELNASDFRTKDVIERLAGAASQGASFSGKKRLILLDEVDGLQSADRGGAGAIAKILKESHNPVILTANDIYGNQNMSAIRGNSEPLQFKKINYLSIAKHLRGICEKELIGFEEDAIKDLAQNCEGDLRSALIDLQNISFTGDISSEHVKEIGFRQRKENIFNIVKKIFRANSVKEVREARYRSEVDSDLLMQWIHENIPREFKGTDIANAMNYFSKGDVFEGRIFNRQNYGFKRYSYDLMSAGAVLSRENEYNGWTQYMFPQLLKSLSSSKSVRSIKRSLCKKVGKRIHSSSKGVMLNELPLLEQLFENKTKAPLLAYAFSFDENEVAFLMHSKPETKKVQKVLEEAQEIKAQAIKEKRFSEANVVRFEKVRSDAGLKRNRKPEETKTEKAKETEETKEVRKIKRDKIKPETETEQRKQTTLFNIKRH